MSSLKKDYFPFSRLLHVLDSLIANTKYWNKLLLHKTMEFWDTIFFLWFSSSNQMRGVSLDFRPFSLLHPLSVCAHGMVALSFNSLSFFPMARRGECQRMPWQLLRKHGRAVCIQQPIDYTRCFYEVKILVEFRIPQFQSTSRLMDDCRVEPMKWSYQRFALLLHFLSTGKL